MSAVLEKVWGTFSGANGRSPGVAGIVADDLLQAGPVHPDGRNKQLAELVQSTGVALRLWGIA